MNQSQIRYKKMQRYMCGAIALDIFLFIIYLIAAGNGIVWLKVIVAILTILLSILFLGFLYLTKELLRPRSLWLSAAAAAIAICTLFSLVLNFPSPAPRAPKSDIAITDVTDP